MDNSKIKQKLTRKRLKKKRNFFKFSYTRERLCPTHLRCCKSQNNRAIFKKGEFTFEEVGFSAAIPADDHIEMLGEVRDLDSALVAQEIRDDHLKIRGLNLGKIKINRTLVMCILQEDSSQQIWLL